MAAAPRVATKLRLPPSIHAGTARLAKQEGVSFNALVTRILRTALYKAKAEKPR